MIVYHVKSGLKILFVGINPHYGSFSRGVPFSNNKNFWYLLNRSGIIKENINDLRDDKSLFDIYNNKFSDVYKLGLLNIVNRPSKSASDIKKGEEKGGVHRINAAIKRYKPKVVCFIGKVSFQKYDNKKEVSFGWKGKLYDSKVFVSRFPIRGPNSERIKEFIEIKRYAFGD